MTVALAGKVRQILIFLYIYIFFPECLVLLGRIVFTLVVLWLRYVPVTGHSCCEANSAQYPPSVLLPSKRDSLCLTGAALCFRWTLAADSGLRDCRPAQLLLQSLL